MRRAKQAAGFVAVAWMGLTTGQAAACEGTQTLIADEFAGFNAAWGKADKDFTIGAGKLSLKPNPGMTRVVPYKTGTFQNIDACVTVTMPGPAAAVTASNPRSANPADANPANANPSTPGAKPGASVGADAAGPPGEVARPDIDAGLVFWYVDPANYAVFEISSAGGAAIGVRRNGTWEFPFVTRNLPGFLTESGASHTIRVTLNGDTITTGIDGQRLAVVRSEAPPQASGVGLTAGSTGTVPAPVAFSSLKVTDLPAFGLPGLGPR